MKRYLNNIFRLKKSISFKNCVHVLLQGFQPIRIWNLSSSKIGWSKILHNFVEPIQFFISNCSAFLQRPHSFKLPSETVNYIKKMAANMVTVTNRNRCGYMTGNRQAVQRLLNDRQLEIVKCVSPLTTISGTY